MLVPLLVGAILSALPLIFPQLGVLQWVLMIPMIAGVFALCRKPDCRLRTAYGYGFLTVYVFYVLMYHWFVNLYPLDFVGMDNASSAVVIAAGVLGLPILQAVLGGFVFLFFRLIERSGIFEKAPLLRPFVFASLWVVFEWSSTIGWTGVPWGRLALGQVECLPILQSASLFGSYFVSWLLLAVNGLLAFFVIYKKREVLCASLALSLFLANAAWGLIAQNTEPEKGDTLRVAVIQGNINSHEKWSENSFEITRNVYGELTRRAAAEGAELVVWPETAFPSVLTENSINGRFVSELARSTGVTLIVGALKVEEENDYNALYLIDPEGNFYDGFYAKRHLVPFGEYVPMRDVIMTLIPPLANLSALGDDLSPGEDEALFVTEEMTLGSLICFDSIYEELSLSSVREDSDCAPVVLRITGDKDKMAASAGLYSLTLRKTKAPEFERDAAVVVPAGPFKVKNSHTGKINTFYQNSSMAICLRDENGKDLWGVPFGKPICGCAHNVDYFANGKLQIAFGAGSSIYVIDRLGRYVGGFPVDLGKEILVGPDIYDFSGSRRYNAMVLHKDNTIDMYNLKGRKPEQWKGITAEETIKGLPQRLTLSGKDFWIVRTSIQTLIFPFYGGSPLTVFEGDEKIRPDAEIKIADASTVRFNCYDGKERTLKLK